MTGLITYCTTPISGIIPLKLNKYFNRLTNEGIVFNHRLNHHVSFFSLLFIPLHIIVAKFSVFPRSDGIL